MRPADRLGALGRRLRSAIDDRFSPEGTRRQTWFESVTVGRLPWASLVRLSFYLELFSRTATALWILFLISVPAGVDWTEVLRDAINAGRPVRSAFALVLILPTLAFIAARSALSFARWRLQREMWRRDVERLTETIGS